MEDLVLLLGNEIVKCGASQFFVSKIQQTMQIEHSYYLFIAGLFM